ncbi:Highly reducing polyketide synthase gloL [Colletotrichum trifolii]|uniref:Highly reducing polyketide synthase gloL n=1 Tax=Colletotrichum trifolii TaxID=5466 RepID=A0A4R8RDZ7_COLTR|nr:Highly reducing polyketide synthase gloL [Colletotrichum trifolii]
MAATDSRGVDVVLNQLSGELLQASWQCVAEVGSLVELGRRDFLGHAKLAMEHFRVEPGLCRRRPDASLGPHAAPFRQMQKSQHIGKLVVTMPETEAASTLPTEPIHRTLKMRKDRSCLPTIPSTFFFPFSSTAATGGWWGQANYHAGNAFVESFAAYRRRLGLVLNVGFISDAGYVADRPGRRANCVERMLMEPLPGGADDPASRVQPGESATSSDSDSMSNEELSRAVRELSSNIVSLQSDETTSFLATHIGKTLCEFQLRQEPGLDLQARLTHIGMDSLVSIEIRAWIRQWLGVDLATLEIVGSGNLHKLAVAVQKRMIAKYNSKT